MSDPLLLKIGAVLSLLGITMVLVVIIGGAFRANFWLGILAVGLLLSGLGGVLMTAKDVS